jgi:hypothetical protein
MLKERIEQRIAEVKAQRGEAIHAHYPRIQEVAESPYYLNGLDQGFRNLLACPSEKITVENLEAGRQYYERGNGGGLSYRQGIMDAYDEVKSMLEEV